MKGGLGRMMNRREDEREQFLDLKRMGRARQYFDWMKSPCYTEKIDSIKERLRSLNTRTTITAEEAQLIQGQRIELQTQLDNYEADEKEARRIIEKTMERPA